MAPIQRTIRLLAFNPYDTIHQVPGDEESNATFTVQMFGITEAGETVCLFVEGFQPFFWVQVPENWGEGEKLRPSKFHTDLTRHTHRVSARTDETKRFPTWPPKL